MSKGLTFYPLVIKKHKMGAIFFHGSKLTIEKEGKVARHKRLIIHASYKCNVDCPYYFEVQDKKDPAPSVVMDLIREAIKGGTEWITFAGGEPLLDENLPLYAENIRSLKEETRIEVCTNAILCADFSFAKRLKDSGITDASICMPTKIQDTYKRMMGRKVSLEAAMKGMFNLEKAGIRIEASVVLTRENMTELPELVSFVHQNFADAAMEVSIVVPERIKLDTTMILPEFGDVKEHIVSAVNRAISLDVKLRLAEKESLPPCVLLDTPDHMLVVEFYRGAERDAGSPFMKVAVCDSCFLKEYCFGIRKSYINVYGDSELQPVSQKLAVDLLGLKFPASGRRLSGLELIKIRRERRRGVIREI